MKKIITLLLTLSLIVSCADAKTFNINGKSVVVEPYGFMNEKELKQDSVVYEMNTGNIVWSVIFSETIVIAFLLLGWELYEPVALKTKAVDKKIEKIYYEFRKEKLKRLNDTIYYEGK